MSVVNPCLSCGACCAHFRVSFYWSEAHPELGWGIPETLLANLNIYRCVMRGTDRPQPRCEALLGDVGHAVRCTIYEQRPSPCREFKMAWEEGQANTACDRARQAWGLPPISPPSNDDEGPLPNPRAA